MACQILHQLLLCRFFPLLVRAREAAPETLLAAAHHSVTARSTKIDPWAPRGRFLKFFNRFLADQKNMFFWQRTKTPRMTQSIDPWAPQARFGPKKESFRVFWAPFLHPFFDFFQKSRKIVNLAPALAGCSRNVPRGVRGT